MEAGLTALLAGVAGGRRYWGRAPQGTSAGDGAYLTLNRISSVTDYHMAGASGYFLSRVQADIYAETYAAADTAAGELVTALSAFTGTAAGTVFQAIFIDGERDLPAADAGEASHLFRRSIDLIIHHD